MYCSNQDYLSDISFVNFEKEGKMIISKQFPAFNIEDDINIALTQKTKVYIEYHNKNIFKI